MYTFVKSTIISFENLFFLHSKCTIFEIRNHLERQPFHIKSKGLAPGRGQVLCFLYGGRSPSHRVRHSFQHKCSLGTKANAFT